MAIEMLMNLEEVEEVVVLAAVSWSLCWKPDKKMRWRRLLWWWWWW